MPLDMSKAPMDLENIDYDDVLHLYRGWRRAELALQEKIHEYEALKTKFENSGSNQSKFRDTNRALESVKDLSINLQSQLTMMKTENAFLTNEVKVLTEAQQKMSDAFKKQTPTTSPLAMASQKENTGSTAGSAGSNEVAVGAAQLRAAKMAQEDVQSEFDLFRTQYQEMEKNYKNLESVLENEKQTRVAAEARCTSLDEVVDSMRRENASLRVKMDAIVQRANCIDQELAASAEQLTKLSKELANGANTRDLLLTSEAEVGVLKGDIARLLRLMEHYPAARDFVEQWHDSRGMAFTGMPLHTAVSHSSSSSGVGRQGLGLGQGSNEPAVSTTPQQVFSSMTHGGNVEDEREFAEYEEEDRRYHPHPPPTYPPPPTHPHPPISPLSQTHWPILTPKVGYTDLTSTPLRPILSNFILTLTQP